MQHPIPIQNLSEFFKKYLFFYAIPVFLGVQLLFALTVRAAPARVDLTALSLEDLMNIEITSVARKPQKLSETAAAAFIITQEDIKRSGVTTIMDALRMAPGVQVAQIDGNKWAVTARGFNGRFANKLLVLIDGRTIYSPVFSGVLWEGRDVLMEDIERIEVIRGPGASVWGANAVNGIINIITKSARDTQGVTLVAGGGTHERAFGSAEYGGKIGENTCYRLFARASDRGSFDEASGHDGNNDWQTHRAGFRMDGQHSEADEWSLQGGVHKGDSGQTYMKPLFTPPYQMEIRPDADMEGGYLLGNWTHRLSNGSETGLQLYYTHEGYDDVNAEFSEDTVDLDFQHRFTIGEGQEVTWGAAYRLTRLDAGTGLRVAFDTESRHDDLFSAFIQDEIVLVKDSLSLTVGSKFEHNDCTGVEIQPSARILWQVNDANAFWGAVSRAVRTPTWAETTTRYLTSTIPPMPDLPPEYSFPTAVYTVPNDKYDSEEVWAYEAGFRSRLSDWVSLDLAVFYNDYDNLGSVELGGMGFDMAPVPHNVVTGTYANDMKGHSYGVEVAADFLANEWWKLRLAYTWLKLSMELNDGFAPTIEEIEDASPEHQISLFSMMDLTNNVKADTWFRYVARLKSLDVSGYMTLDARIAWTLVKGLELSLVGQNLLEDAHNEYRELNLDTGYVDVERSVYAKLTWQF